MLRVEMVIHQHTGTQLAKLLTTKLTKKLGSLTNMIIVGDKYCLEF